MNKFTSILLSVLFVVFSFFSCTKDNNTIVIYSCTEDYKNEYDLINELYLEVSIYAEFALNPSGSLNSYSTEMNEMQQEISKLIKAADIY